MKRIIKFSLVGILCCVITFPVIGILVLLPTATVPAPGWEYFYYIEELNKSKGFVGYITKDISFGAVGGGVIGLLYAIWENLKEWLNKPIKW